VEEQKERGGRARGASSGRTYESLRTAARIVLHYYMRGGGGEEATEGEERAAAGEWIRKIDQAVS